jgi:hypothetical protein
MKLLRNAVFALLAGVTAVASAQTYPASPSG